MSKGFNVNRKHPRDTYFVKDFNNPNDKGHWKMSKLTTKEDNMKYHYFTDYSWRNVTPISEYEPEHNYPVQWNAFESTTKEMVSLGWTIDIELNKYTGASKACFRNKDNGMMTRIQFTKGMKYMELPLLFAVKNYKLRAATFTESFATITEDMIPQLLDAIRAFKREKVSNFVLEQKKQEVKDKVVELGNYLHNQQAA